MNNKFGGKWTEQKNEIIVKYAKAFLTIMNKRSYKTIYFDGFAGSGEIEKSGGTVIEGVAKQILAIDKPCSFDIYYMVEKDEVKANNLKDLLDTQFPNKKKYVVPEDCNIKLIDLAGFLKKRLNYRALAFIDPHGMQVNWSSISVFKGLNIDMWMLIPTGIGVNRMLTKSGNISDTWMEKLEQFLGLDINEIKTTFYKKHEESTLFGNITSIHKDEDSTDKVIQIYTKRMKEVWDYVSVPFSLVNTKGSTMFHFILASQNKTAEKIASEIIKKIQTKQ